jgi:hypothetical protein
MDIEHFKGKTLRISIESLVDIVKLLIVSGKLEDFICSFREDEHIILGIEMGDNITGYKFDEKTLIENIICMARESISNNTINNTATYYVNGNVIAIIPANSVNSLKNFLKDNEISHPIAISIMGARHEDCQNYRCPHISHSLSV